MKIAFTVCSNNYLANAKILGDTFLQFHPDFKFIIGLVDKLSDQIDYSVFSNIEIIPVEKLNIIGFDNLVQKFNIIELNTTVKPFYFSKFFFSDGAEKVIYIDPDIQIFKEMTEVLDSMKKNMITLTPHMLSPIDDGHSPSDFDILVTGIFNLGFIALSKFPQLNNFLQWWSNRCVVYGFRKDNFGMFYDQIWMNYVPCFFESYSILKHPGYNIANWNLHERKIKLDDNNNWAVNNQSLVFFHFSHYNIEKPDVISSYNSRFNFENRKDIKPIFDNYRNLVISNNGLKWKQISPAYNTIPLKSKHTQKKSILVKIKFKVFSIMNKIIPD